MLCDDDHTAHENRNLKLESLVLIHLPVNYYCQCYRLLWAMLKQQTNLNIHDIHNVEILPSWTTY